MAKELPYWKFEPNQWENGNIQICSKDAKGVFIDLCSSYWSRLGELPYALALQKHCNGSKDALQELKDADVIGIEDDNIIIEFLDEQLNEFQETSVKRRDAANKRWSNASALQKQSKSNAIRGEKKKEEERRGDKGVVIFPFESETFSTSWNLWKDYKEKEHKFKYKTPTSEQAALLKLSKLSGGQEKKAIEIINESLANGWQGFFEIKETKNGKSRLSEEQQQYLAARTDI
jgi:hypothetical protein